MDKTICIFGDSIAWGAYDPEKGGWANRLKIFLQEESEEGTVYNLGICGQTTADILERFETESQVRQASALIFAIGINDAQYLENEKQCRTPLGQFKKNIKEIIIRARKITEDVIFIGLTKINESKTAPIFWQLNESYLEKYVFQYDEVLKSICEKEKVPYIHLLGIVGIEDLEDGLHPNSCGHEKIFQCIKEFLIKFLKPAR